MSFASFALDPRLKQAIAKLGFSTPTPIQMQAIPLALEGKDILAKARTGSGKTLAYCLPILHALLLAKSSTLSSSIAPAMALILVPTRELAEQAMRVINDLTAYCHKEIRTLNLATDMAINMQLPLLNAHPDIIVSTPSRILTHLVSASTTLIRLRYLVVDEADLVLSFGYTDDLRSLLSYFPSSSSASLGSTGAPQTYLMSATLTSSVDLARLLALKAPITIELKEFETTTRLKQFAVRLTTDKDKFLLVYFIFKLRLIRGKSLVFVNNVDRAFRVKLFLEQFGIRSCVLNSEMPINSRVHVVAQFNKGLYDILIATDELEADTQADDLVKTDESLSKQNVTTLTATESSKNIEQITPEVVVKIDTLADVMNDDDGSSSNEHEDENDAQSLSGRDTATTDATTVESKSKYLKNKTSKKNSKETRRDAEYSVSRGIDFHRVTAVVNFDFPNTIKAYTHRVGRTARAGQEGMALSLILEKPDRIFDTKGGPVCELATYLKVAARQEELKIPIRPFNFDMSQVDALRYRAEDAMRTVTRFAIREARIKELKNEVLNSVKLQAHFEDNPIDLSYLRHDKPVAPMRVQPHLKNMPSYLLPAAAAGNKYAYKGGKTDTSKFLPYKVTSRNNRKAKNGSRGGKQGKGDPLKQFRL